jgi:GntR family transcriptional regulator
MIDPNSDRAAFQQLADILRDAITSGALAPGAPVSSEERLRQEYMVSRTTVREAIKKLKSEGLVVVEAPRGTFVRRQPPVETVTLRKGDNVTARMPNPSERREHDLPEGIPLLVVNRASGEAETYAADRTRVTPGP